MIFSQHWYAWLFMLFAITCVVQAGSAMTKDKSARMIWFILVACVWSGLTYYNWQS